MTLYGRKKNGDYFQTYEGIVYLITKKSTETIFNYSSKCFEKKNKQRNVTGELEIMPNFRVRDTQIIIEVTTSSSVSWSFCFVFFFFYTQERERETFSRKSVQIQFVQVQNSKALTQSGEYVHTIDQFWDAGHPFSDQKQKLNIARKRIKTGERKFIKWWTLWSGMEIYTFREGFSIGNT